MSGSWLVRTRWHPASLLFEHRRILDESGVPYVLTCFFWSPLQLKRTFRSSASCSCLLTDMGSAVRSFHGNCRSQPVKQSR